MSNDGIHMLFLVAQGQFPQVKEVAQAAIDSAVRGLPVQVAFYVPESPLPVLSVPEEPTKLPFLFLAKTVRVVNARGRGTPGGLPILGLTPAGLVLAVYEQRNIGGGLYWRIGPGAWIAAEVGAVTYAVEEWKP